MRKLIFAGAAAVCLTGCASSGLVHDKGYLRAAAVSGDRVKRVTMAFFSDETVTAEGESLEAALHRAELLTGREIFTGFTELVLLSEENGAPELEYMLEHWKVSPDCAAAYCENGRRLLEKESPERIRGWLDQAVEQDIVPDCGVVNVLAKLLNDDSPELAEITEKGAVLHR